MYGKSATYLPGPPEAYQVDYGQPTFFYCQLAESTSPAQTRCTTAPQPTHKATAASSQPALPETSFKRVHSAAMHRSKAVAVTSQEPLGGVSDGTGAQSHAANNTAGLGGHDAKGPGAPLTLPRKLADAPPLKSNRSTAAPQPTQPATAASASVSAAPPPTGQRRNGSTYAPIMWPSQPPVQVHSQPEKAPQPADAAPSARDAAGRGQTDAPGRQGPGSNASRDDSGQLSLASEGYRLQYPAWSALSLRARVGR
ncbi:hypothetical protein WJX73_010158 [Symbiochloris irregularis]|uniref:Uncharacterized protein n=1 Tax=Symbiochloris irregularis TaxID=706552 RepID=A0AAW1P7U3_9CHLO